MENTLTHLSSQLVEIVERFSSHVVAVHARRHFPSSGVIWGSGMVVTADHTVQRDEEIQVTLSDGKSRAAQLAGRDPGTDLALLKVESLAAPAPAPAFAEKVQAGELALVLGRSPDSGPNASLGIISAVSGPWRTWRGGRLDQYIRLDAKFFPNSSGGAVISARGEVVGIGTAALSRMAGLAIPAPVVRRVAEKLQKDGSIARGYLGVGVQSVPIPDALRVQMTHGNQSGGIILGVEPGGPADQAGLLIGDVIVALGDSKIEGTSDVQTFADSNGVGASTKVSYLRAGSLKESTLVVGERPRRKA
ncbi:MAG TPA: trypsin-like peptidase domain-containing protein [bacterium]|nr:trypsin-like peptidase domain-containing protein [bacterium]